MRRVSVVLVLEEFGFDFLTKRSSATGSCSLTFTVSAKSCERATMGMGEHDDLVIALALAVWWELMKPVGIARNPSYLTSTSQPA
jgi:hypothetical protein